MHVLLATSWLDPFTHFVAAVIAVIDGVVHNSGWSLVLFALVLKLVTWPLSAKQFSAMVKMQQLAPQLKRLQEKYSKTDPQRYQQESMELYRKNGANPLAGCWPMLISWPFFAGVYYAVTLPQYRTHYQGQHWLWIGSALSYHSPILPIWKASILATSLTAPDLVLLIAYAISMYFFSRYGTMPSTDPQQAQTQKIMALVTPLLFSYIGFQAKWPSAMVLYWLSFNIFNMAQQFYMLRRHHLSLSVLDNEHAITDIPAEPAKALAAPNGATPRTGSPKNTAKRKKGAKR